MKKLILLFPALFCLTCSQAFQSEATGPDFNTTPLSEMSITEDGNITLPKTALEKEYLLQASFIDASGLDLSSPSFHGTQSRIITFAEKNHSLFMMESNKGLLSSEELPAEWILAQFKIISEDESKLVFDFNEGMKNIFVGSDWYGSDEENGKPPTIAVSAPNAFLKEVKNDRNRILIRQVAQLEISAGINLLLPVEVVYYLENYSPDPDFKSIENKGFDRVGFFEANPTVREGFGNLQTAISHWNIKKPIVYSISDNTPKEFVDAIKEGVLYWNKVFGADIVQVQMAPTGITAPDPDYNIIQWVTNHYAGFAYADAQMDPRTGEILHAQIYLTSTFSVPVENEIDVMEKTEEKKNSKIVLGLKGFSGGLLCEYPLSETPSAIGAPQKMTSDYIRTVVAHEVGHTLGLRHNFAGSAGSKLLPKEISNQFNSYLKTGEVPLKGAPTSSVMDYLPLKESVLNGKYIGTTGNEPLAYDAMAIASGYYEIAPAKSLAETLYCSDALVQRYSDCRLFDGGGPPLLSNANNFEERIEKFPNRVARIFLLAKTNFDPLLKKPVGNVALPAEAFAHYLTAPLETMMGLIKERAHSLLVERTIGTATDSNQAEIYQATTAWLDKAVASGGGLKNIMADINDHSLFDKLDDADKKFEGLIGGLSDFTDQEKAIIKRRAKPFFEMVKNKVLQETTQILVGSNDNSSLNLPPPQSVSKSNFRPLQSIKDLENILGNWAEFIVTDHAEVSPTFDGDLRLLAAHILLPGQGPTENWEKENRAKVLRVLLEKLAERYGRQFNATDDPVESQIIQILSGETPTQAPAP